MISTLEERAIEAIVRANPEGLTAHQILGVFASAGTPISEATFRKYVQLGLLPRSRRVGLAERRRGSQGVYPASTVRHLARVKSLIGGRQTVEDLRRTLALSVEVEQARDEIEGLVRKLGESVERAGGPRRRDLDRMLRDTRDRAGHLIRCVEELERALRSLARRRPRVAEPPAPPLLGPAPTQEEP